MKFNLGKVVATPGALEALEDAGQPPIAFLSRHMAGDWGDLDASDKASNEAALKTEARILSAYHTARGVKLWIITEADRSSTCILLPSEY